MGVVVPASGVVAANGFEEAGKSPGREAAEAAKDGDCDIGAVEAKVFGAAEGATGTVVKRDVVPDKDWTAWADWAEDAGAAEVEGRVARAAGIEGRMVGTGVAGSRN